MNRSQSTLASILDGNNKDTNKRSLWGTLRSKRKVNDDSSRRKSSNAFHRLSVSSSSMTINTMTNTPSNHFMNSTYDNISIQNNFNNYNDNINSINNSNTNSNNNKNNNHITNVKTNNSTSTTTSPANSRPVSMTASTNSYSLDPHANRDTESTYSSSRNSVYSARSMNLPAKSDTDKKNNRFSRIFDAELFGLEEPVKSRAPQPRSNRDTTRSGTNKRHSVMFGKSSVPQDFLRTLQQIPSNEENNLTSATSKEMNRLSLTFEDYKLALEAYGDEDDTEIIDTSSKTPDRSISSSPYVTDSEEFDDKMEIKIYSNCIWIGSCQSSIHSSNRNKDDTIINAKVNKIDIRVNDDLDRIFNEDEDDEDDKRVVQRTSLYFT